MVFLVYNKMVSQTKTPKCVDKPGDVHGGRTCCGEEFPRPRKTMYNWPSQGNTADPEHWNDTKFDCFSGPLLECELG